MKKIAIISINDNTNFGNRLQTYALNFYIRKLGYECSHIGSKISLKSKFKLVVKFICYYSQPYKIQHKNRLFKTDV